MKTVIRTMHEEEYVKDDSKRILGVLVNYSTDGEWKESFTYTFKNDSYVVFNTIIEMLEYLFYGNTNTPRGYITEADFDKLYDAEEFDGKFRDKIEWI